MDDHIYVAVSREKDPDFVSRSIMKFTKANYSHIFIIHRNKIIHSVGDGVKYESLQEFEETHDIPHLKKVNLRRSPEFVKGYVEGVQGRDYSESQYIGFILPFLRPLVKNGRDRTICSEFVARLLNVCCGYNFKNLDFLTPKDVIEHVIYQENL